jgi:hypothetical protein
MTSSQYISGRKKYQRPQALLFSENPGTLDQSFRVPLGYEVGSNTILNSDESLLDQFIILSDDNRQPINVDILRIENRERMINGRMRSHHIADKKVFSVSWSRLPSRAFSSHPNFNLNTGKAILNSSGSPLAADDSFTTDGGAGGVELKSWYEKHKGPFWVFASYDNYKDLGLYAPSPESQSLIRYSDVLEMYITDFSFSIQKRGGSNHDLWDISITLEEV